MAKTATFGYAKYKFDFFFSSLNRTEIFLLESKVLLSITKVLFRCNPSNVSSAQLV